MEAVKRYLDRDGLELYDSLLKDMIGEIAGRNIVSIDDNPDGSITITYTDGTTWTSEPLAGRVTGVKGNAESSYREGDVNITLDDIGLTANDITSALGYTPVGTDFHVAQTATTGNFDRRVLLSATDTDTTETSTTFKNGDFTYNASTGVLTVPHIAGNPGEVISALEPSAEDQVTGDYWIKVISTQQDGTKIVQKYQKQGDGTYAPISEAVSASAVTLSSGNTVQDFIGTTSISGVGDGSITGAISSLNTAVNNIDVSTKLDKANSSPLSGNKVVVTNASGKAIASSVTTTDLEGFSTGISNAATAASDAATAAAAAQSTADGAATTANSAYTRSGTAISTANSAASDASSALSQVGDRLATSAGGTTLGANKVVITDEYGKAKASTVTASDLANMSSNISTAVSTANSASSTASSALTEANKKLETQSDTKTLTANRAVVTSNGGYATASTTTSTEIGYLTGVTSNVQTQLDGKASSSHSHSGYVPTSRTINNKALTTDISLSYSDVGAAASSHTHSGYQSSITGGATTITNSNLTASRALVSNSSGKVAVSDVTSTELGYLDGVTSNIQTQLNNKAASTHTHSEYQSTITGGATSITSSNLTTNRALISNSSGKVAVSDSITTTELNCLDGVTSNIQNQLDNLNTKFSGTISSGARKTTTTLSSSAKIIATLSVSSLGGPFLVLGFVQTTGQCDLQAGISYSTSSTVVDADTNAKWLTNRATTDKMMVMGIVPGSSSGTTYIRLIALTGTNGGATAKGSFSSVSTNSWSNFGAEGFLESTRLYVIPLTISSRDSVNVTNSV